MTETNPAQPDIEFGRYVTIVQAAALLGVGVWTIRTLMYRGRLHPRVLAYADPRRIYFERAEVEALKDPRGGVVL